MNAMVKPKDQLPAVQAEPGNVLAIISRVASDPAVDVDKLERLMQMHERMQASQQRQEFDQAMARAQAAMRRIEADANNPQTRSKYASYPALDRALRPIYSGEGFSLSFDTGEAPGPDVVRLLCIVAHRDGHRETRHVDMPADGKGAKGGDVMTKTHATGSAITYGKRYLLGMIFNVAVGVDVDDDGNAAGHTSPQDEARAREFAEAIAACDRLPNLEGLGKQIATSKLPEKAQTSLRALYTERLRDLKGTTRAAA